MSLVKLILFVFVVVFVLALLVAVMYSFAGVEVPGVVQPLADTADTIVNIVP